MGVAAIFCAFLAPFFALIIGLALATFSPLKRSSGTKKFFTTALFVAGITALGWAPLLLSSNLGWWTYAGVLALSSLYQAMVILFVSTDMMDGSIIREAPVRALRADDAGKRLPVATPRDLSFIAAALDRSRRNAPPLESGPAAGRAAADAELRSPLPVRPQPALVSRR
jgi:hypothetical protein